MPLFEYQYKYTTTPVLFLFPFLVYHNHLHPIVSDLLSPVTFICCYYVTIFFSVVEPSLPVANVSICAIPFIVTDVFENITVHNVVKPFVFAPVFFLAVFGESHVPFYFICVNAQPSFFFLLLSFLFPKSNIFHHYHIICSLSLSFSLFLFVSCFTFFG